MSRGSAPRKARIADALCRCGGPIESACCEVTIPGTKCPLGVCRSCGRTWRRVPQLPLVAQGAGTRDGWFPPSLIPLREVPTTWSAS